jgi:enoyl-CoA hydratase/carnithine racemase
MADEKVLLSEHNDGVLTLTLNRPRKLNAMSHEVFGALNAAISAASADRTLRAVIITGAGTTFSAGADLDMVREFSSLDFWRRRPSAQRFATCSPCSIDLSSSRSRSSLQSTAHVSAAA